MSSEHQRYSIENQTAAIREYAKARGYKIIRTYADTGRSGLSLKGRHSLQRLLADVLDSARAFSAILVLDVSRWGRFQDVDQAAHYEYLCRAAGLKVAYVAEPFENDLSAVSVIMKTLKRIMAGEYSRELSVKLSRAHEQQARLGFKQGGTLVYGFRRLLLDEKGTPRFVLDPGQRKAISTDRVIIVPGPPQEQKVIRRIFRMYVTGQYSRVEIAARLNKEGILATPGQTWSAVKVRNLLRSELCIGCYTYNVSTSKLQSPTKSNPGHLWIRVATGKPIVSVRTFRRAQRRAKKRRGAALRDEHLLDKLRKLLKQKGRLSHTLLRKCPSVPSNSTYRNHFGSLIKAYELIGYDSPFKSGKYEPWTNEELVSGLKGLFARQGYLSVKTINEYGDIPCADVLKRRFGSLKKAYIAAGLPVLTHSECQKAARERQLALCRKSRDGRLRKDGSIFTQRYSSEAILSGLRKLHRDHGYISGSIISEALNLPSVPAIARRFGGLLEAYRQAGYYVTQGDVQSAASLFRKVPKPRPAKANQKSGIEPHASS
jgi:DNA invertase Pin-like site-specific DNA recombinase